MLILVVDDEPLVAETLSLVFRSNGFDVVTAFNAERALAAALLNPPDLVLCDIDMPGRDGISLMEDLSLELPKCPILVLTGFYSALARVRAFTDTLQQKVAVVTKPCAPQDLLRHAVELLNPAHAA